MGPWSTLFLVGVLMAAFVLAAILWAASRHWRTRTDELTWMLKRAAPHAQRLVRFHEFDGLPVPVRRYLRRALREGQAQIRTAHVSHAGDFRTGDHGARWNAFVAEEFFALHPPGFVWDARIRLRAGLHVYVRDAYLEGRGAVQARLLGLVPMVDHAGAPELNSGALMRYLAEAVWFPTAFLPGNGITWQAIDDRRALASLADHGTDVSLEFRFGPEGDVDSVFSPARFRAIDGSYRAMPWGGVFRRYEEHGGMRIPTEAEVRWELPDGPLPYWRARVTAADYEFGP